MPISRAVAQASSTLAAPYFLANDSPESGAPWFLRALDASHGRAHRSAIRPCRRGTAAPACPAAYAGGGLGLGSDGRRALGASARAATGPSPGSSVAPAADPTAPGRVGRSRSEEHTSELQSP